MAANSGSGPAAAKQPEVWLLVLSKSVLFKKMFGSRIMHCQVGEVVAANSASGRAAAKQPDSEVWLLVLSKSVLFLTLTY